MNFLVFSKYGTGKLIGVHRPGAKHKVQIIFGTHDIQGHEINGYFEEDVWISMDHLWTSQITRCSYRERPIRCHIQYLASSGSKNNLVKVTFYS